MAPRTDFYQSDRQVTLSVYRKKLDAAKVHVTFHPQRVEIDLGEGGPESTLDIDLYAPIDPGKSSYKVLSMKLDVVLAKVNIASDWPRLTRDNASSSLPPPSAAAASQALNPASSAASSSASEAAPQTRRGFSKVATDLDDSDDDEAKAGTDIDAFFKQLYSGASEETRRAMVKSYLESNGTALSTNWDEVSKATVPTKPPAGMEPKQY